MRNKITYLGYTINAKKIARATIGLEQSLPMLTLGIDTFECEVKCPDKSILQFDQNTPLCYFHREKQMGIYYVQSIERVSPDHYSFSAISTLGLLEQMDFHGGIYTGQTVAEVVASICGNIPYIIKTNLQNIKLYGWLGIMSARLALQQVLFAIGANLVTDANGVLRIENLWDGISGVLDKDRIYSDGASVKQDTPYTSVTVLEHQYIPGTERKDLFEGTTTQGQTIPFDAPMSNLEAEGFTILSQGANYATVSAGSGKLTGIPYTHTTMEVTKPVTNAPIKNEKRVEDATLVSLVNSNAVAERLAAYYACREIISVSAKVQQEHPGQVVQIYHPYDKEMVQAAIDTSSVNVSGVLKADLTALIGFLPPQVSEAEYYDDQIILTGTGQWIPPEGIKDVRAVLIGGGQGGSSGLPGKPSTPSNQSSFGSPTLNNRGIRRDVSPGGDGGAPGSPGHGGRVYQVTLELEPGVPIPYNCGVAGTGGQRDTTPSSDAESTPGTDGTDTQFGIYSSSMGAPLEAGFYDPVSGQIFAAPGKPGVPGGKGGGPAATTILGDQEAGPDVVYNGVTYTAGPIKENFKSSSKRYSEVTPPTNVRVVAQYGVGGGAAAGANGNPATDDPRATLSGDTLASAYGRAVAGPGGKGADAIAPDPKGTIGTGGDAGNGGGGAGGYGAAQVETFLTGYPGNTSFPSIGGQSTAVATDTDNIGLGSDGGTAGPGGIIVYFKRPKPSQSGLFMTKNKALFAGKDGRQIIV